MEAEADAKAHDAGSYFTQPPKNNFLSGYSGKFLNQKFDEIRDNLSVSLIIFNAVNALALFSLGVLMFWLCKYARRNRDKSN